MHFHVLHVASGHVTNVSDYSSVFPLLLSTAPAHPGNLQRRPWRDPNAHIQVWRHQCSGEEAHTHARTHTHSISFDCIWASSITESSAYKFRWHRILLIAGASAAHIDSTCMSIATVHVWYIGFTYSLKLRIIICVNANPDPSSKTSAFRKTKITVQCQSSFPLLSLQPQLPVATSTLGWREEGHRSRVSKAIVQSVCLFTSGHMDVNA